MEKTEQISLEDSIQEHFRQQPIKISPWKIAQFFENESNIGEEYLDKSLDTLKEILPDFEKKNREIVEELQKAALLAVPMFRKMQIMTLLTIIRESASSSQAFPFLPDFPKPPAANLLNHIFRDDSRSDDEKKTEFGQIAKNSSEVLKHLISWRDHVASYIKGLETFLKDYEDEMSEEQTEHVTVLLERSKKTIPQINGKIEQKSIQEIRSERERAEFEKFFKVLSKEEKYTNVEPDVARSQIRTVFDELDPDLRRIIARISEEGDVSRKRLADGNHVNRSNGANKKPRTILVEAKEEKPLDLAFLTAENH